MLPLLSLWSPWDFPFPPPCVFLGSIPWQCPPGQPPFLTPLHMRESTASVLEVYFKGFIEVQHTYKRIYPCSFHQLDEFSHNEATCDQYPRCATHTSFLSPMPNTNHHLHLQYLRLDSECSISRIYFQLSTFLS